MCKKDEYNWCKRNCLINEMRYYQEILRFYMEKTTGYLPDDMSCAARDVLYYQEKFSEAEKKLSYMGEE